MDKKQERQWCLLKTTEQGTMVEALISYRVVGSGVSGLSMEDFKGSHRGQNGMVLVVKEVLLGSHSRM